LSAPFAPELRQIQVDRSPRATGRSLAPPEPVVEPGSGERPVSVGRAPGKPQGFGGLSLPEAREEPELHKVRADGVLALELLQRLIERKHVDIGSFAGNLAEVDLDPLTAAAAFETPLVAGAVEDNPAHGLGRGGEEVTAAVPLRRLLDIHEAKV